jgi:predicted HTH transcriptional regulator
VIHPDALRELIGGGETLAVEFKGEERAPLNDRDLVETLVCLANRSGNDTGWLLVGIEDDGCVTGARPRHGSSTDPDRLAALIAARTRPSLSVRVFAVTLDGASVLAIEVPPQRVPVATSDGVFLRRALGGDGRPACLPMDAAAMQSLQADRGLLDPSEQVVAAADWHDLDPLEFERFRRSVRERRGRSDESLLDLPDLELAKALGAVHFQWHADRIEISNPGGLPEGVRLDNLLVTAPRPRNPLLADAVKRAGIVERTARGIDIIFYEQLRNGRPAPSYARSDATAVVVVIPGGEANLDFVRLLVTEAQSGRRLGLDELLILNALWQERSLRTEEAARLTQKPEADARATLHRLVEARLVEARGQKKGRTWHLSAAAYRALGDRAAYVRQRGFEPLQQEQMVLQYVEKHSRITRREAAQLCRIASHQAGDLLSKLVARGELAMHGARKGAFYVRPPMDLEGSKSAPDDSKNAPNPPKLARRGHPREADE